MNVGVSVGFQNPPSWQIAWPRLYEETFEFVSLAEQVGLDEVWVSEHHFADDGYCPSLLPVAAAIGARTSRIRIGTKAILMPFHNPLRLAEDAAVVDVISNGRLDLGIVAGYRVAEFNGFGIDPSERASRTEEGLDVLVKALSGARFTHEGQFFTFRDVQISPLPVQRPLPLWLGGRSPGAMRRAARYGGHLALADFIVQYCEEDYRAYSDALVAAGRDPRDFEVVAVSTIFVDEDAERAWHIARPHLQYHFDLYQRWFEEATDRPTEHFDLAASAAGRESAILVGTPDQVVGRIRAVHDRVPFTRLSFWCLLPGLRLEVAQRSLELFAKQVLPEVRRLGGERSS